MNKKYNNMVVAFLMHNPCYKRHEGESGNYNGYVAFKEELPLSMRGDGDWNKELLDDLVNVHGGITLDRKSLWKEAAIIPLTAVPEDIHEYRVIGFDTGHVNDTAEYWTFERTKEETLNLKEQIEELIKSHKHEDKNY